METNTKILQTIAEATKRYPSRLSGKVISERTDHGFTHIKYDYELSCNKRYVLHEGVGFASKIEITKITPSENPESVLIKVYEAGQEYERRCSLSDIGVKPDEEGKYHRTNWLQDPSRVERFPLLAQLLEG